MAEAPKRRNTRFLLGLLLIALAIPLAWWLFLREPPPPPLVPVAAIDAGTPFASVHLAQVEGTVEVRHGADGGWTVARPGDVLSPKDGVRTKDGSYAMVVGDEYWEVKMESGTEVGIGELSDSISHILLESGMARATVRGGGRHTFEVRSADTTATTDGGVFTMANNGAGTVAVGTEVGEVRFVGQGRVVIVRAGQQSIARPGQGPADPTPIPNSLLLKVSLPGAQTVNRARLVVRGQVEPGSLVQVQGHVVPADDKGKFQTAITLSEGENAVDVRARSVGGLSAASPHKVELDTTVKPTTIDPNLWK